MLHKLLLCFNFSGALEAIVQFGSSFERSGGLLVLWSGLLVFVFTFVSIYRLYFDRYHTDIRVIINLTVWLIFVINLVTKFIFGNRALTDFNQLWSGLNEFVVTMETFHTAHCLALTIELVSNDVALL